MTNSYLASPSATREVLDRFGLGTKKSLGQNFLIDDNVIGSILELADIGAEDVVLEIGPGIGTLTVAMLPRARAVISVERDLDLVPVLHETCARDSDRFVLIPGDALDVSESQLRFAAAPFAAMPTMLVANLPYQVAATVILGHLERFPFLCTMTVMVQSEVADRIAAEPDTREYGAYTAKLALHGEVTGRFSVPPGCFFPPPHVMSSVVRIDRRTPMFHGAPASRELVQASAEMADASFFQRRKNIRNSMNGYLSSRGYGKDLTDAILHEAGVEPGIRGETLAPARFLELGAAFLSCRNASQ